MATRLKHWLSQFCTWHEEWKKGELDAEFQEEYNAARADLSATLVVAQRLEFHGGAARQALRVARAIPVEFEMPTGKATALTQDISISGLSALVGQAPEVGTPLSFRLKLGRDIEDVTGSCHVVAAIPAQGSVRMAVTFDKIVNAAKPLIEDVVLDTICAEIRTMLLRSSR